MAKEEKEKVKEKVEKALEKVKAPKKPSYQSVIVETLKANKGVASREMLISATGADAKNISVSVSILRNGKRTKNAVNVQYLRSTKTFYLIPEGEKAMEAAIKAAENVKVQKKKEDKKKEEETKE
jgi:hypothetical protein